MENDDFYLLKSRKSLRLSFVDVEEPLGLREPKDRAHVISHAAHSELPVCLADAGHGGNQDAQARGIDVLQSVAVEQNLAVPRARQLKQDCFEARCGVHIKFTDEIENHDRPVGALLELHGDTRAAGGTVSSA